MQHRIIKRPVPHQKPDANKPIKSGRGWVHLRAQNPSSGAFVPVRLVNVPKEVNKGDAFSFSIELGPVIPGLPLPSELPDQLPVRLAVELPDGSVFSQHNLPTQVAIPIAALAVKLTGRKINKVPDGGEVRVVAYGGHNHFRGEVIAPVTVKDKQ